MTRGASTKWTRDAEQLIREGITVSDFDYPAQFDEAAYLEAVGS